MRLCYEMEVAHLAGRQLTYILVLELHSTQQRIGSRFSYHYLTDTRGDSTNNQASNRGQDALHQYINELLIPKPSTSCGVCSLT